MTKRETKRNAGRMQARHGFTVCKNPTMHLANDGQRSDRIGITHVHRLPSLFAIARDARTIFASWTIDWRAVFEKAVPADRQVHLRVIGGDGTMETTVAVEPMSAMHFLTISGLHDAYRVEIGYFQPFDTWQSVATSGKLEIPSQRSAKLADVDLASIPFHISFQELANFFGSAKDTPITRVVSEFRKRVSNGDKPNEPTRFDTQILNSLNLSPDEIAATERDFTRVDSEKLARRTRAMLQVAATSPVRGFEANPGL